MDSEHQRRVSQLAALFGSDTNGHLRTNRNLTELWSQFDSQRRGALDQNEFTSCLQFMASRSSAAGAYINKDDAGHLWRRLDELDDGSKTGVVSVPSLVVFVRSALMAQWSQHRGTVDGTSTSGPQLASRASVMKTTISSSERRRRRRSGGSPNRPDGTSKPSPARSTASASATSKQSTASPSRSRRGSISPGTTSRTTRPPSPGGVGLYDVIRRARVRAACEADSLELGYLEPGERVEVIESRNTRTGDRRVKVLFERGVVDWTGQRRVGWTSLVTPSGSVLLLPVNGRIYRPSSDTRGSTSRNGSPRDLTFDGLDLSLTSGKEQVPEWVKRLSATPSSARSERARRPSSVSRRGSSGTVRPRSGSRSTRAQSKSPSRLHKAGFSDDEIVQAGVLTQQLSPHHTDLANTSTTPKQPGNSSHRRSSSPLTGISTIDLASANEKLATTVARTKSPELAAGLAQAELMIEDVRMDCARRVAEAEASRQHAEEEAAQLRRALRNAVDELQRTVTERNQTESRDTQAEKSLQEVNLKLAALQAENEHIRTKAAARPPVDLCGLWQAKGVDADGQEIEESFVLEMSEDGQRLVGSHAPDANPAEYFTVEDFLIKDSVSSGYGGNTDESQCNDGVPSVVLSFVQRYEDPGAMPTRWQARLEPPGMVGWWFTDTDDDGVQDETENGGTFTATRETMPGTILPQVATEATDAARAAKAEAQAAAAAAKVHLGEAEEARAALAVAEMSVQTLKEKLEHAESDLANSVHKMKSFEQDAISSAERIAELEEKLSAEIAAGEDRAQGYREDLTAAASRVDSLAAALSEAQSTASSDMTSPRVVPAAVQMSMDAVVESSDPQLPSSIHHRTRTPHEKTKEQLYAEASARVAQELAIHRQKWTKT